MTKVYGYYRVSTQLQADKGYSLAAQVAEIESYCKAQGWQLVRLFSDEGISGTINDDEDLDLTKRPGVNDMLGSLKGIDRIVVVHTNRLWRNVMAQALIQREIRNQGADVASIQQPSFSVYAEVKDPTAFLINTMLGALDTFDKMNTVNKMTAGKDRKAQEGGKPSGFPPLGYKYDGKNVVVDSKWAGLVKSLFTQYLALGSLGKVVAWLAENNHITPRGKAFSTITLHAILSNEFYLGRVQWRKVMTNGKHESIISPVLFGKVQSALKKRNKKG